MYFCETSTPFSTSVDYKSALLTSHEALPGDVSIRTDSGRPSRRQTISDTSAQALGHFLQYPYIAWTKPPAIGIVIGNDE